MGYDQDQIMPKFKIKPPEAGQRADVFVASQLTEFSRSSLTGLFKDSHVSVNDQSAKPGYKLRAGDKLEIDTSPLKIKPEVIDLPVIYEDADVVVINKPAGLLTHSKGALNEEATVASWLLQHLKKTNHNINSSFTGLNPVNAVNVSRLGIVHRLDRATSGVIITAKHAKALDWLQKQFSQRRTKKTYLAVVEGQLNPNEALIDAPIGRHPKKPQTFKVQASGKAAQTKYQLLKSFTKDGQPYSLVGLTPVTGRTHQIRVHLAYIGHPVVGDRVYGQSGEDMLLHALSLEVVLPSQSRKIFKAPPPASFNKFIGS